MLKRVTGMVQAEDEAMAFVSKHMEALQSCVTTKDMVVLVVVGTDVTAFAVSLDGKVVHIPSAQLLL